MYHTIVINNKARNIFYKLYQLCFRTKDICTDGIEKFYSRIWIFVLFLKQRVLVLCFICHYWSWYCWFWV